MRITLPQQPPLAPPRIDHRFEEELCEIDRILLEQPRTAELVLSDLLAGDTSGQTGRPGMTAEQVLRCAVLKCLRKLTYEDLAYHLRDSNSAVRFCRLGFADRPPSSSTLWDNIHLIRPETWEAINKVVLEGAAAEGVENAEVTRVDCTAVDANIHEPSDSSLLLDCVRTLTRLLRTAAELAPVTFSDHVRRAKRRAQEIQYARGRGAASKRASGYRDLLKVARKTLGYAQRAVEQLRSGPVDVLADSWGFSFVLSYELEHYVELTVRVLEQTERRVLHHEKVPAAEKVLSIFEPHVDVIVKGDRKVQFGHKTLVEVGRSSMVLDLRVLEGNPADATLVDEQLQRHTRMWGKPPRQIAFDGGFASKANLELLKQGGVQDVAFHKKRGLLVEDMAGSKWIYRKLRRFRNGVEGVISFLKRCFGWARAMWRGRRGYTAYLWNSVVTANLLVYARHRLA